MSSMAHATSTTPANEIWRPIRDFENLYEVSNLARVRSLDRTIDLVSKKGNPYQVTARGRILKQRKNGTNNYLFVALYDGDRVRIALVHRLVAEAFIPNPDNLPEVNHKDEDKTNNLPSNLEWCEHKYNMHFGTGLQRRAKKQGKRVEQLTMAGQHVAYFDTLGEVVRATGYNKTSIWTCCVNQNKTAYGYQWRYI